MLRTLVLLLILANAGFYAWTQGWLKSAGLAPQHEGEPERLKQQIRPEAVRVLPAAETPLAGTATPRGTSGAATTVATAAVLVSQGVPPATAGAGASANETTTPSAPVVAPVAPGVPPPPAGQCLQTGIFDAAQTEVLRRAASALPSGSWALEPATLPGRWMVYIGRLADNDAVAKKRSELKDLSIGYDRPGAALEPGLSLGRFSTEEAAQRGLAGLAAKGARSARVVQERRDTPGFMLRLPNADAKLRAQVQGMKIALAGKSLRECE